MMLEYVLIGLVLIVLFVDYYLKSSKDTTTKLEIFKAKKVQKKSPKNKLLLISALILILFVIVYLIIPFNQSTYINVDLVEVSDNKLQTPDKFEIYFVPDSKFGEIKSNSNPITLVTLNGSIKDFYFIEKFNFGNIDRNTLLTYYKEKENEFQIPVILLRSSSVSKLIYEYFGDGFWTSNVILKCRIPDPIIFPNIEKISTSDGILINNQHFINKNHKLSISNTFEYNYLISKGIPRKKINKSQVEAVLSNVKENGQYFISAHAIDYETSYEFLNKLDDEYISKTIVEEYSGKLRLSRNFGEMDNFNTVILIFLTVLDNGKYHSKLIGKLNVDNKGPIINSNWSSLGNTSRNEFVDIEEKVSYNSERPFVIKIRGKIDRLFIGGHKIQIDKNKNYQEIFKVLNIPRKLGYHRIPVIAYDLLGNRTDSFIEGL